MKVLVIIKNVGTMINADVNVQDWLIQKELMKGLFGILVIVNASAINYAISESI